MKRIHLSERAVAFPICKDKVKLVCSLFNWLSKKVVKEVAKKFFERRLLKVACIQRNGQF